MCTSRPSLVPWPGSACRAKKCIVASDRNNYKRAQYWRRVSGLDVRRLRFIDEAGINLAMTRLYGRVPRGERVVERVPRNYGAQTSLISNLSLAGVEATMSVEGAVDTEVFNAYVEQVLRPTLRAGDVVVLDNLAAHRASHIEQVAAEYRATVIRLSSYSPDYSPIEMMWSKIKSAMRAAKARTKEDLEQAFNAALQLGHRSRLPWLVCASRLSNYTQLQRAINLRLCCLIFSAL
jgi:transposase